MLGRVVVENGVKKIVPLTADCGSGNPCGAIITVYQRTVPNGYLPLGAQYDITQFPVLYSILGTDTIPTASALGLPTLTTGQYVIKATSGINENQADNVLSALSPVNAVTSGDMHAVTSNAVADKINSLDVSSVGGSGKYISAISETDGKINATSTDLGNMVPVDTVTSGNMHSVTSNAVAGVLGGIHFIGRITSSQSSRTYYKINNFLSYSVMTGGVFLLQSRGGELCLLSAGRSDSATIPKVKRLLNNNTKIIGFTYSGTTLYIWLEQWANFLSITQIGGDERKDVTISTATQSEYNSGTAITIET